MKKLGGAQWFLAVWNSTLRKVSRSGAPKQPPSQTREGLDGSDYRTLPATGPLGVAHQQSQPTGAGFGSWQEVRGVTHKFESCCASSELPPKLFPLEMCRVGIYSAVFVMASLLRIASGGTRNPQVSMTMVITPIRRILDLLQCDFNDSFGAETSHGLEYRLLVLKA